MKCYFWGSDVVSITLQPPLCGGCHCSKMMIALYTLQCRARCGEIKRLDDILYERQFLGNNEHEEQENKNAHICNIVSGPGVELQTILSLKSLPSITVFDFTWFIACNGLSFFLCDVTTDRQTKMCWSCHRKR